MVVKDLMFLAVVVWDCLRLVYVFLSPKGASDLTNQQVGETGLIYSYQSLFSTISSNFFDDMSLL